MDTSVSAGTPTTQKVHSRATAAVVSHDPLHTVLVLRTTVNTMGQVKLLAPALCELLGSSRWTIDLEDRDRVLRIEQGLHLRDEVMAVLKRKGFMCAEFD